MSQRKAGAAAQDRASKGCSARAGAATNAAARLAFDAAQRSCAEGAKPIPASVDQRSFEELRRAWLSALAYLSKFELANPSEKDVLAARRRLEEIEVEWERRSHLRPDDPDYFPWPSTDAPKGLGDVGVADWEEIGMLSYLGYHVGRTSELTAQQRAAILSHTFGMRLPPLNSAEYMKQWGLPETSGRLQKMAETLAALARNGKRRRHDRLAVAVQHWELDLSNLREMFYVGRFDFGWPQI